MRKAGQDVVAVGRQIGGLYQLHWKIIAIVPMQAISSSNHPPRNRVKGVNIVERDYLWVPIYPLLSTTDWVFL